MSAFRRTFAQSNILNTKEQQAPSHITTGETTSSNSQTAPTNSGKLNSRPIKLFYSYSHKDEKLREKARSELGAKFDLRGFHDLVLTSGAIPLDVLESRVNDWAAKMRSAATAGGLK